MKRTLFLLSLLSLAIFHAKAQEENEIIKKDENGLYCYEEVVSADGVSQAELFKRAKNWILANMKTEDNNINFDEKNFASVNTGALKVDKKHFFGSAPIQDGAFDFKFHVWSKDGRYKIRIDNIMTYLLISGVGRKTLSYDETKKGQHGKYSRRQINEKLPYFITTFKKAMTISTTDIKKKNDW